MAQPETPSAAQPSGLKLALDFGPLLLFFVANWQFDLRTATAVFMVASVVAVAVQWVRERKLPIMPLITLVIVLVFGGLTLALHDDTFIKMKPTLVYGLFALVLAGGMVVRRPLLKHLFGTAFQLDADGWRILTLRWIGFFITMAVLNEMLWRVLSTDQWVAFKTFGALPLTLLFAGAQLPLLRRHGAQL